MHSTKQTPLKHGSVALSTFVLIYNQSPELFTFYRNEAEKQWAGDNPSQPLVLKLLLYFLSLYSTGGW